MDDFLDRTVNVRNLQGEIIFTGTPRQWRQWVKVRPTVP